MDGEHSRGKCKNLRNNSCRDKSQIQEKRKLREVSNCESSEDKQFSSHSDDNEVNYLSLLLENEMERKIRELHGSFQGSSYEEPPFKDHTKVLKDRGKNSGPINFQSSLTHFGNKKREDGYT